MEQTITGIAWAFIAALTLLPAADVLADDPQPTDMFIVEGKGSLPSNLGELVTQAGGTLVRRIDEINQAIVHSTDPNFPALIEANNSIKGCMRDHSVQWIPSDPGVQDILQTDNDGQQIPTDASFYSCQWGLDRISILDAWRGADDDDEDDLQLGNPNVKVAVIDGGVDPFHQDLADRVDTANSLSTLSPFPPGNLCDIFFGVPDSTTFQDFDFHGTFAAAQIASNGIGIAGVAPNSTIVGIKSLNCLGFGSFADINAGIVAAAQVPGVEVINMSLGALLPDDGSFQALIDAQQAAIDFATSQGVLVVASSGNDELNLDGSGLIHVPSMLDNVVSVSATDINDSLASYSNAGRTGADVAAPGGDFPYLGPPLPGCNIPSVIQGLQLSACSSTSLFFNCPGDNFYLVSAGTSFAAPIAAGIAALAEAEAMEDDEGLGPRAAAALLSATADDLGARGPDPVYSDGRVNAAKAIEEAEDFAEDFGDGDDDDDEDDDD